MSFLPLQEFTQKTEAPSPVNFLPSFFKDRVKNRIKKFKYFLIYTETTNYVDANEETKILSFSLVSECFMT